MILIICVREFSMFVCMLVSASRFIPVCSLFFAARTRTLVCMLSTVKNDSIELNKINNSNNIQKYDAETQCNNYMYKYICIYKYINIHLYSFSRALRIGVLTNAFVNFVCTVSCCCCGWCFFFLYLLLILFFSFSFFCTCILCACCFALP